VLPFTPVAAITIFNLIETLVTVDWTGDILHGTLISQFLTYLLDVGSKTRWAVKTVGKEKERGSLRAMSSRDKDVTIYEKKKEKIGGVKLSWHLSIFTDLNRRDRRCWTGASAAWGNAIRSVRIVISPNGRGTTAINLKTHPRVLASFLIHRASDDM